MTNEIIDYLNEKTGSSYKANTKKTIDVITARINEGYGLEDFKRAIDNKVSDWTGTEHEKYLRPETLFGNKMAGYVNEKRTDVTSGNDRRSLLKEVLRVSGIRDITEASITIYGEIMKMVKTEDLPQFAVSIIRHGGEFMRPDQMISEAVKVYEQKIITEGMQRGSRISDYEKFVEFIRYSFRGKPLSNDIQGIFRPYVTISLDRDGIMVNNFNWKKLSSSDETLVYKYLFDNQQKVGVIKHCEVEELYRPALESKAEEKKVIESNMVKGAIDSLVECVKV